MAKVPATVIIAVRNGADFIGEALQSVFDQTRAPEEVIVIDDGSTDQTPTEVRRFTKALYVRQPALGFAHAQNHGVRRASKPFVTFLDADDLWHPTKTEDQFDVLSNDAELDFVFGNVVQFSGCASQALTRAAAPVAGRLFGALTIRLDSFKKVGPFTTAWTVGSPIDWWVRADDVGLRGKFISKIALLRRIHDRNNGRTTHEPMRDYLSILHSVMKRRREKR